MRMFLIAAALAAATAAPALATTTTDSLPVSERQSMQMPNLPQDAQASDTGLKSAPEAAPIVEARRRQRR